MPARVECFITLLATGPMGIEGAGSPEVGWHSGACWLALNVPCPAELAGDRPLPWLASDVVRGGWGVACDPSMGGSADGETGSVAWWQRDAGDGVDLGDLGVSATRAMRGGGTGGSGSSIIAAFPQLTS